jgi:hypothetical protein
VRPAQEGDESETSSLFLEKPVEITAAYQDILESLAQTALGKGALRGSRGL